jgi:hypothetical protein
MVGATLSAGRRGVSAISVGRRGRKGRTREESEHVGNDAAVPRQHTLGNRRRWSPRRREGCGYHEHIHHRVGCVKEMIADDAAEYCARVKPGSTGTDAAPTPPARDEDRMMQGRRQSHEHLKDDIVAPRKDTFENRMRRPHATMRQR